MTIAPALPLGATARVSEARRARNREHGSFFARLRCECGLPGCRKNFPAAGESYRGTDQRFIVVPAHLGAIVALDNLGDCAVVRAADRFFVVEPNKIADRFPGPAERAWFET